jgi:membrane protease YdiL (CAAX protease family)
MGPYRDSAASRPAQPSLILLTVVAAAPAILLAAVLPPALLLPSLSLAALALAALAAAIAWIVGASRRGDHVTLWDVAGAFTLIGCAAAMLSKPESILALFGQTLVP